MSMNCIEADVDEERLTPEAEQYWLNVLLSEGEEDVTHEKNRPKKDIATETAPKKKLPLKDFGDKLYTFYPEVNGKYTTDRKQRQSEIQRALAPSRKRHTNGKWIPKEIYVKYK